MQTLKLSHIKLQFDVLSDHAVRLVEIEARRVLAKHPNLEEFVMAMGGWFFVDNRDNKLDEEDRAYLKPFADLVKELDDRFKVTGEPMRFTCDGDVVTDWGATDVPGWREKATKRKPVTT